MRLDTQKAIEVLADEETIFWVDHENAGIDWEMVSIFFNTKVKQFDAFVFIETGLPRTMWKIDVQERVLTFNEVNTPIDWDFRYSKYIDNDLGGFYLGNRSYGCKSFNLYRYNKYHRPSWPDNGEHFRQWRGGQYAWELGSIFEYKGDLYTKGLHFW